MIIGINMNNSQDLERTDRSDYAAAEDTRRARYRALPTRHRSIFNHYIKSKNPKKRIWPKSKVKQINGRYKAWHFFFSFFREIFLVLRTFMKFLVFTYDIDSIDCVY